MGLDRRIGSAFLGAGPGYGGSCFPKDCDAMLATADDNGIKLNVISSAVATNDARKNAMATARARALEGDVEDNVVAVLGLTFKADTDDVRETPAFALIDGLKQVGISVRVFDPQGMEHARQILTDVEFCGSALDACSGADCAVIATEWREFRTLGVKTMARVMRGRTIVDLRNLLDQMRSRAKDSSSTASVVPLGCRSAPRSRYSDSHDASDESARTQIGPHRFAHGVAI